MCENGADAVLHAHAQILILMCFLQKVKSKKQSDDGFLKTGRRILVREGLEMAGRTVQPGKKMLY